MKRQSRSEVNAVNSTARALEHRTLRRRWWRYDQDAAAARRDQGEDAQNGKIWGSENRTGSCMCSRSWVICPCPLPVVSANRCKGREDVPCNARSHLLDLSVSLLSGLESRAWVATTARSGRSKNAIKENILRCMMQQKGVWELAFEDSPVVCCSAAGYGGCGNVHEQRQGAARTQLHDRSQERIGAGQCHGNMESC